MTELANGVWGDILGQVREAVRPHQFQTWFENLKFQRVSDDTLYVSSPNAFIKDWVEGHYMQLLSSAAERALAFRPSIEIVVEEEPSRGGRVPDAGLAAIPEAHARPATGAEADKTQGGPKFRLNKNYTFDNFVTGPCNQLPYAASLAVVENPAQAYNPLFLHGSVGLGKTHLMQAICHVLLERHPELEILYLSCESFVNQFISAIEHSDLENFRNKFRRVDVLVIDDVHFLANKERTQEEFFHTFNVLYNAQRQIVLSSDAPPKEIPSLGERLVSRFKWGLVCQLVPPSFETRVAIIKRKAGLRGRTLSDEVAHFLASQMATNVRELEGAVVKVVGYASLANRDVDIMLVKESLSDVLATNQNVSLENVKDAVIAHFGVKLSDLQSKRRSQSISYPRQIAMYLARELTNCSLEEVGGYFGGRDHTTVLYATEKIRTNAKEDPKLMGTLETLTRDIKNLCNETRALHLCNHQ